MHGPPAPRGCPATHVSRAHAQGQPVCGLTAQAGVGEMVSVGLHGEKRGCCFFASSQPPALVQSTRLTQSSGVCQATCFCLLGLSFSGTAMSVPSCKAVGATSQCHCPPGHPLLALSEVGCGAGQVAGVTHLSLALTAGCGADPSGRGWSLCSRVAGRISTAVSHFPGAALRFSRALGFGSAR